MDLLLTDKGENSSMPAIIGLGGIMTGHESDAEKQILVQKLSESRVQRYRVRISKSFFNYKKAETWCFLNQLQLTKELVEKSLCSRTKPERRPTKFLA